VLADGDHEVDFAQGNPRARDRDGGLLAAALQVGGEAQHTGELRRRPVIREQEALLAWHLSAPTARPLDDIKDLDHVRIPRFLGRRTGHRLASERADLIRWKLT
jgi:hypothetical protein